MYLAHFESSGGALGSAPGWLDGSSWLAKGLAGCYWRAGRPQGPQDPEPMVRRRLRLHPWGATSTIFASFEDYITSKLKIYKIERLERIECYKFARLKD